MYIIYPNLYKLIQTTLKSQVRKSSITTKCVGSRLTPAPKSTSKKFQTCKYTNLYKIIQTTLRKSSIAKIGVGSSTSNSSKYFKYFKLVNTFLFYVQKEEDENSAKN